MSVAEIRELVKERVSQPDIQRLVLARAIDRVSLQRIKAINRVVGRASQSLASSSFGYLKPDIPDYQKYLYEYVRLKRLLGLYRKSRVSEGVSDQEVVLIAQKIGTLESQVREAREEARKLRFGSYSARSLHGWGHFDQ